MLNIFFISNDSRVEKLIEHFQPFLKSKIRKASDFDQGLKEVFENRPSAVFIQSDIGTVSGETVARHIKSLLGSDSPRIIFMGEDDAKSKTGNSWCDDWILLGDSEQVFHDGFSKLIAAYYPEDWGEIYSEISKTAALIPASETEEESPEKCVANDAAKDGEISVSCEAGQDTKKVHGTATEKRISSFSADMGPADDAAVTDRDLPAYPDPGFEEYHAHDVAPKKSGVSRVLHAGLFLLLILAVATGAIYSRRLLDHVNRLRTTQRPPSEVSKTTGKPESGTTKQILGMKGLPSFIHAEWRNLPYTESHPGWEKYVSSDYEFLLFRENDAIKAFQVVAQNAKGISEPFIASVLKEMGFTGVLPSGVSERKNGFLVKRVVIDGFAEFVTYREEGHEQVKAFVLEFF